MMRFLIDGHALNRLGVRRNVWPEAVLGHLYALDMVRDAVRSGMHVHVGRVNEIRRFLRYSEAGAHTCDGSGISRYDHMLLSLKEAWYAR